LAKDTEEKKDAKPKRFFAYGGGNSAFSQIMREEMSKKSEAGAKKLDRNAYNDIKQTSQGL
jgi:hypothetical protein